MLTVSHSINPTMVKLLSVSNLVMLKSDSLMWTAVLPYSYPFARLAKSTSRFPPGASGSFTL